MMLLRVINFSIVSDLFKIIPSVRSSLRDDLILPHLDTMSTIKGEGGQEIATVVLLLAVSGGSDSVALFHAVSALLRKNTGGSTHRTTLSLNLDNRENFVEEVPCEIHVAHFNHEQRGDSSDKDEAFVQRLCVERGIPFHNYFWSDEECTCAQVGGNYGEGISTNAFTQDIARKWRRRKLKDLLADLVLNTNNETVCETHRWGAILTAHHADDSDETILLKLLRGSHLSNLRGIEARSEMFNLTKEGYSVFFAGVGYFAKPMLQLRKNDIAEFLNSNAFEWREDESNATNKYKRNKVRNELIPLMRDLAGGEHALQKRLKNIDQQSRAISDDLKERAELYLAEMPSQSDFWLPDDKIASFDLLYQEAFYIWASNISKGKLQLSYDQINRIKFQIEIYSNRLQWTLDVGDLWKVKRNGNVLTLLHGSENLDNSLPFHIVETKAGQFIVTDHTQSEEELLISLPLSWENSVFTLKSVKDVGNVNFQPQWRKGKHPIKIKEFLRGQKIPLHLRDKMVVLCLKHNKEDEKIIAVHLKSLFENRPGRWIIESTFEPKNGRGNLIKLKRERESKEQ